MGRRVWFHEMKNFLFNDRRVKDGPTLREFWGAQQDRQEVPVRVVRFKNRRSESVKNWLSRVKHDLKSSSG